MTLFVEQRQLLDMLILQSFQRTRVSQLSIVKHDDQIANNPKFSLDTQSISCPAERRRVPRPNSVKMFG